MSVKIMDKIWKLDLPPIAKFVALALADYSNEHGNCFPSLNKLSLKCGLSSRTIIRQLKVLEEKYILKVESRGHQSGGSRSNFYTFNFLTIMTESHKDSDRESQSVVTHSHPPSDTQSPPLVTHSHPLYNEIEPSHRTVTLTSGVLNELNTNTNIGDINTLKRKKIVVQNLDGFNEFWEAYPKHRRSAKADCQKIWHAEKLFKISTVILQHITHRVLNDSAWISGCVYASKRFLKEKHWLDEYHLQPQGRQYERKYTGADQLREDLEIMRSADTST